MERYQARNALRALGIKPSKRLGQNFAIGDSVVEAVIDFGKPSVGEALVEIGAGLGALTAALSPLGKLAVIEIEDRFCRELQRRFPQVHVIQADVRRFSFADLGKNLVVFGNLPYSFSTEIVLNLVSNAAYLKRAVILLQREFAERIAADPGGRSFGAISVACQLWADVSLGPVLAGSLFYPAAEVDSQVVELKFLPQARYPLADAEWFRKVVRAAFSKRRKKLYNSLTASGLFSREVVDKALCRAQLDGNRRAETLGIEEFVALSDALHS